MRNPRGKGGPPFVVVPPDQVPPSARARQHGGHKDATADPKSRRGNRPGRRNRVAVRAPGVLDARPAFLTVRELRRASHKSKAI